MCVSLPTFTQLILFPGTSYSEDDMAVEKQLEELKAEATVEKAPVEETGKAAVESTSADKPVEEAADKAVKEPADKPAEEPIDKPTTEATDKPEAESDPLVSNFEDVD